MTVFIYVDTSKEVGDPDHLKVFANADAADTWLEENEPEGVAFESEMIGTFAGVWFALPACATKPQTGRRRPQLSFQELGPFLKTTRSVCDPLCLPLGLPCSFRPYWSGLSYRRMRHWLSQHIRRSVRPRRMAARFARSERVPGYIPAKSTLRPLPPMESAILDVYSHLNRPGGLTGTKKPPLVGISDGSTLTLAGPY
jgi:hypothetical protein